MANQPQVDERIGILPVIDFVGLRVLREAVRTEESGRFALGDRLGRAKLKAGVLPIARSAQSFRGGFCSSLVQWISQPRGPPEKWNGNNETDRISLITGLPSPSFQEISADIWPPAESAFCSRKRTCLWWHSLGAVPGIDFAPVKPGLPPADEKPSMMGVETARSVREQVFRSRAEDMVIHLEGLDGPLRSATCRRRTCSGARACRRRASPKFPVRDDRPSENRPSLSPAVVRDARASTVASRGKANRIMGGIPTGSSIGELDWGRRPRRALPDPGPGASSPRPGLRNADRSDSRARPAASDRRAMPDRGPTGRRRNAAWLPHRSTPPRYSRDSARAAGRFAFSTGRANRPA